MGKIQDLIRARATYVGLTNENLAEKFGVSERTITRWLTHDDVSLGQCLELCEAVGVSFEDIAALFNDPESNHFEYSEKQEQAFVSTPGLLAYFQQLLSGQTLKQINKKFKLTDPDSAYFLRKLDDLGFIQWHGMTSYKLKIKGEPSWRNNGPLAKHFRKKMVDEFLWLRRDSKDLRLGIYEMTEKDAAEVKKQLDQAFETARIAENRARLMKKKTSPYGIGSATAPYSPDFLYKIPKPKR